MSGIHAGSDVNPSLHVPNCLSSTVRVRQQPVPGPEAGDTLDGGPTFSGGPRVTGIGGAPKWAIQLFLEAEEK